MALSENETPQNFCRLLITKYSVIQAANLDLYQGALSLTHVGDSQTGDFLIHDGKHMEACDGGSDWSSI
jgi:hypothetical protein